MSQLSTTQFPIGAIVRISESDSSFQAMTTVMGQDKNRSILIGLPQSTSFNIFNENMELHFNILAYDKIHSFDSKICGSFEGISNVLLVQYPEEISVRGIRNQPRFRCTLPSDLYFRLNKVDGIISNVSAGGCQFRLLTYEHDWLFSNLKEAGEPVALDVYLPFDDAATRIKATIKSVTKEKNDSVLGLAFDGIPKSIAEYLDLLHLETVESLSSR